MVQSPSGFDDVKQRIYSKSSILNKNDLRSSIKRRRREQDPRAARLKDKRISKQVLDLESIHRSETIALYSSLADEVDTTAILSELLRLQKTVVLPKVVGKSLEFRIVKNIDNDLSNIGSFGIDEPADTCPLIPIDSIDLFIIPGIAFDRFGGRIGFGGGYYDRVLHQKRSDAISLAIAYEFQVVHAVSIEEHDKSVDMIVTEQEVYHPFRSLIHCSHESDTMRMAETLLQRGCSSGNIFAMHADLGTGKTVFVKGMASAIGAIEETISPTFIYCREYHGSIVLHHIDAYRIETVSETDQWFWDEIIEKEGMIIIEWAERLSHLLPKSTVHLLGTIRENNVREWILVTTSYNQTSLHGELSSSY
jgi:5-formyltetrahydrofolate cyclo-ligase